MDTTNRYRSLYRPVSFATLPYGLKWEFVEAPWELAHRRTDIPRSNHRHGVFVTDRPLSEKERDDYAIECC